MVLYALTTDKSLVFAKNATTKEPYYCIECASQMRLRRCISRQEHFYHVRERKNCRHRGKGLRHQHIQAYLLRENPKLQLEKAFPSIKRIADLAWQEKLIVFEIQCSPISLDELSKRNLDYKSLGYDCVWILDEARFNQNRLQAAEKGLESHSHYYAKIEDNFGKVHIYDQFEIFFKGFRRARSRPLFVDLSKPFENKRSPHIQQKAASMLANKRKLWKLSFRGDLMEKLSSQKKNSPLADFVKQQLLREKRLKRSSLIRKIKERLHGFFYFFKRLSEEFF